MKQPASKPHTHKQHTHKQQTHTHKQTHRAMAEEAHTLPELEQQGVGRLSFSVGTAGRPDDAGRSFGSERSVTAILPEASGEDWASHPEAASYLNAITGYAREDICQSHAAMCFVRFVYARVQLFMFPLGVLLCFCWCCVLTQSCCCCVFVCFALQNKQMRTRRKSACASVKSTKKQRSLPPTTTSHSSRQQTTPK